MSRTDETAAKLAAVQAEPKQQNTIKQMLEAYKPQIAAALPRHLDADRMARIVMTELRLTPALQDCNPMSLFGAVIQCSQLGIEPGGSLGHAYLVPFKDECQLIIGYRGMIELARRSGQIVSLCARVVHEGDEFEYHYGLHEKLVHIPSDDAEDNEITHVYAIAHLTGGGQQFEVMTRKAIDSVRSKSKAGTRGPWVDYFEEMAKKTCIRRLFKYLPVSIEIQRAVGLDEQADAGIVQGNARVIDAEI